MDNTCRRACYSLDSSSVCSLLNDAIVMTIIHMKKILKKTFGIFCAIFAVFMPLNYFGMRSIGVETYSGIASVLLFLAFSYGAWSLLSPSKKDKESTEMEDTPDVKVSLVISVLVYLVDAVLVWAAYVGTFLLCALIGGGAQSTMGIIGGLLAILVAIGIGVVLPGPKRFMRMINKNKQA